MTTRRPPDFLLIEIEQELNPGRFVRYNDMFEFVRRLHQVEEKMATLVAAGEAERAVSVEGPSFAERAKARWARQTGREEP